MGNVMAEVRWKAAIAGVVIDVAITNGVMGGHMFSSFFLLAMSMGMKGVTPDTMPDFFDEGALHMAGLVIGSFGSFVSGYLTAVMARSGKLTTPLAMGILSAVTGTAGVLLLDTESGYGNEPWMIGLFFVSTILCAVLGGRMYRYDAAAIAERASGA